MVRVVHHYFIFAVAFVYITLFLLCLFSVLTDFEPWL